MTTHSPAAPTDLGAAGRRTRTTPGTEAAIEVLLGRCTLEEKVRLLTGMTAWRLHPDEQLGLRSVVVSDGPVGVRGTGEKPGETSRLLPSPSALAATWDTGLARRVGSLFAAEARRHGVDVVLAPQVNLQRTPVAGRHFECYSEDPLLTSLIGSAVVAAMQDGGVGACVKHFVANDSETARTELVARVDERTLREVYLAPFEHAVREAGVWNVMAAYNGVDDGTQSAPATEHGHLLNDVLKGEWGFDGVVVSDWLAARRTVESATGGLDLVMPGPGGPWEDHLVAAVRAGEVDEREVDDKVRRLLRLAVRVGALTALAPERTAPAAEEGLLRELAARATVVLRDEDHVLPLDPARVRRVALLGPNAHAAFVQGGGSAHVHPELVVSPEDGLRSALPHAELVVLRGGDARRHAPDFDVAAVRDPRTGETGLGVTVVDVGGRVLSRHVSPDWDGWLRDLPAEAHEVRLDGLVRLTEPGEHWVGLGTVGIWSFALDGEHLGGGDRPAGPEVVLDSSVNSPDAHGVRVQVTEPRDVPLSAVLRVVHGEGYGTFVRAALRHRPPGPGVEDEIVEAVAAARAADLVVLVVGTNDEVESEGWDRTTLALPGRQDELVERVLDVAPDAVVVVNAGAPVLLPWLARARTVLWTWFPGQECGDALADVLVGRTEPAGRLPWTLPAAAADVPVPDAIPDDEGVVAYTDGLHVGYRAWERSGATPAAPFGFGLGWTTWRHDDAHQVLAADPGGDTVRVDVDVTNTGPRRGTETVQVYLEADPLDGLDRPVRWLAGFTTVTAEPGERVTATVRLPRRAFEVWDVRRRRWTTPATRYRARIGRSVRDLPLTVDVVPVGGSTPATPATPGGNGRAHR